MQISEKGINLIKFFESLRLTAYVCPAGVLTIGYGTTRINGEEVKPGLVITKEQAENYLKKDLQEFEEGVNSLLKVEIPQEIFDSLVSFSYNVGLGNFKSSTLLKLINQKQFKSAADQFQRWNKAKGKILDGLTKRRKAEELLYREGLNYVKY